MKRIEEIYYEAKADEWFKKFATFCRIALAASFIPAGYVKIMGERFAAGLPSNNPLGHYFDALHQTGYYYTFIGIVQVIIGILLLIPKTSLLGALMYFPIIINICVLTYATRFEGTRLVTMMVLASLFLLIWDYDRLRHILSLKQSLMTNPFKTRDSRVLSNNKVSYDTSAMVHSLLIHLLRPYLNLSILQLIVNPLPQRSAPTP